MFFHVPAFRACFNIYLSHCILFQSSLWLILYNIGRTVTHKSCVPARILGNCHTAGSNHCFSFQDGSVKDHKLLSTTGFLCPFLGSPSMLTASATHSISAKFLMTRWCSCQVWTLMLVATVAYLHNPQVRIEKFSFTSRRSVRKWKLIAVAWLTVYIGDIQIDGMSA